MSARRLLTALLGTASGMLFMGMGLGFAVAGPEGGVVSAGAAEIAGQGTAGVVVTQSSGRVVIDWQSFNTNANERIDFVQPDRNALALNRITGGSPTQFNGRLNANGNVIVMNPNGVVFGASAQVDVNGLVATTSDIGNAAFMNDARPVFDRPGSGPGQGDAAVVNQGRITAAEAGLVGFVAPQVVNQGVIEAKLGKVQLASGDKFTLDLYGDGLVEIAASDAVNTAMSANLGHVRADGGSVALTAAQAKAAVDSLVVNTGVIEARSVGVRNGSIILSGAGRNAVKGNVAAAKHNSRGASYAANTGVLDASGLNAGETGGSVQVLADHVALADGSAVIAAGDAGGGDVRIGGDYLGSGDTATASTAIMEQGAVILNQAVTRGNGGRTILWSDDTTDFHGLIIGSGGSQSGNGGFAETSGKINLNATGIADLTAPHGTKGSWLLDPNDITVYGNVAPNFVSTDGTSINLSTSLKLWLDASDTSKVTLTYSTDGLGQTANGTVGTNTITLSATTANLAVGARIRLGAAGSVATANTMGADTYTITAISGTTITVAETLTQNYTAAAAYRGLVSTLIDKSSAANNASQVNAANMPLWISNGQNGLGTVNFDGASDMLIGTNSNTYQTFFSTAYVKNAASFSYLWGSNGTDASNIRFYNSAFSSNNANDFSLPAGYRLNGSATNLASANSWNLLNSTASTTKTFVYALSNSFLSRYYGGQVGDAIAYNTTLSSAATSILEQYQSAKWGLRLGSAATNAAEASAAMDATTGYNVFTTRYLERLSQFADISLQATNNITLDLKSDTLALNSGRSLTLTAGNNIASASAGTIQTSGAGNITFAAGNDITIAHDLDLNATGTGAVTLRANRDIIYTGSGDVNTTGGAILLNADRDANSAGAIKLGAGTILTSGGGNVTLGGGAGTITAGSGYAYGTAQSTFAEYADSVVVNAGIVLLDAGINAGAGDVILNARGYTTNPGAFGIYVGGTAGYIATGAGDITLNGIGGSGSSANVGVALDGGTLTTSSGNITVTGTGGTSGTNNFGISLSSSHQIISNGPRNITLTGIGGSGANNFGFRTILGTNVVGGASNTGNVTLITNSISLTDALSMRTTGNMIIRPYTAENTVGLGSGSANLQLTDAFLGSLNWGSTLWIGGYGNVGDAGYISNAGNLTLNTTRSFASHVHLMSAADIVTGGAGGITLANGRNLFMSALNNISFTHDYDLTTSGTGIVRLNAGRNIVYSASGDITTGGGSITLNSDRDGLNGGAISLGSGTSLVSDGGAISLVGGTAGTGNAVGNSAAYAQGIFLNGATINATGTSTGGAIIINGTGWSNSTEATDALLRAYGIFMNTASVVQTNNAGTITLSGTGGGTGAGSGHGIFMRDTSSVIGQNGTISVTAMGGGTNASTASSAGLVLSGAGTNKIQATGSGSINATGTGGASLLAGSAGIILNSATSAGGFLSATGAISLTGISISAGTNYGIMTTSGTSTIGGASATGAITLIADSMSYTTAPIIQTTGDIIIRPYTAGKTVGIGAGAGDLQITDAALAAMTWGGTLWLGGYGNVGDAGYISNAGNLTLNTTRTFNGHVHFMSGADILSGAASTITGASGKNISLSALNDITLSHDLDLVTSGIGAVTLRAGRSIVYSASGDITTAGGAIVLNADRDANSIGAISLGSGTALASNGGAITLGGGADPTTGYAWGTASNPHGIYLTSASIATGGGAFKALGHGANGQTTSHGIYNINTPINTGAGTLTMTGIGGDAANGTNLGVWIDSASSVLQSTSGDITLTGTGGNGTGTTNSQGLAIVTGSSVTSVTGNISITGTSLLSTGSNSIGINLIQGTVSTTGTTAGLGNITLNGTNSSAAYSYSFALANTLISSSAGNIILNATNVGTTGSNRYGVYVNTNASVSTIKSTGAGSVTINANAASKGIQIDAGSTLNLGGNTASGTIAVVTDSFNNAGTFSAQTTGDIIIRPYTAGKTVGIGTGASDLQITDAMLSGMTWGGTLWLGGYGNVGDAGYIRNSGLVTLNTTRTFNNHVNVAGANGISLSGGTVTMAASKNLALKGNVSMGAATTLNAATGTIGFEGTVNGAGNLTASAATLTFNGAWGGTTPLGAVTLTSVNSVSLPAITASEINVTASGAAKVITAAALNSGAGNITLTADNLALNGAVTGTGILTLQPYVTNRVVNINNGSDDTTNFNLNTAEIGRLADGWSLINLGRLDSGADINIGTSTWLDPVAFRNNYRISMTGSLTGTGNASFSFSGGSGWINLLGYSMTTAGGGIIFDRLVNHNNGSSVLTSAGGAISFNNNMLAYATSGSLTVNSGNGAITVNTINQLAGITSAGVNVVFNAGSGAVAFNGTVNTGENISATGSSITFTGAWGGTNTLGSVSLTSVTALALPSITAGSVFARATGVAGDLTLGGVLSGSGVGNAIVLVAGRNFVNTAGANALVTAAGRALVYSASPADNTLGGITGYGKRYNSSYAGYAPASVAAGAADMFLYSASPVLTVTASNAARVYGDANPVFGYGASGFIDGDTAASLGGGAGSYSTAAIGADVGSYAIAMSQGGLLNPYNYTLSFADGTLTVSQRALTVALAGTAGKVYDGTTAAALTAGNYNVGNIYNSDDVGIANTGGSYADKNAGTGKLVSVSGLALSGAKAGNYTLNGTTFVSGNIGTVTAKGLTVSATNASKVYGDADGALGYSYTGLAAGDATASFSGALVRAAGENVASYAITQNTLAATGNYSIGAFNNGAFSITPAALTVTANNATRIYGDSNPGFTASYTGLRNGDTGAVVSGLVLGTAANAGSNVGAYAITAGGGSAGNYTLAFADGTLTVTQRALTVALAGTAGKVYDGTTAAALTAGNYGIGNIYNSDDVGIANTSGSYADKNVGTGKLVSVSGLALSGAKAGNYTLNGTTFVSGNIGTVTAKGLTVSATNTGKVYGDADSALGYSYTGLVVGDATASFSGALVRAAGENVASYAITQNTLAATGNYSISAFNNGAFSITPAALTVTANNATRIYGDSNPGFTASYTGLRNGDTGAVVSGLVLGTAANAGSNVGAYAITAGGGSAGNYTLSFADGTLTVSQRALTITANNATRVHGAANPAFGYSAGGLVNGDTEAVVTGVTVASPATPASSAGVYSIVASGGGASNYTLAYVNGSLTVVPAPEPVRMGVDPVIVHGWDRALVVSAIVAPPQLDPRYTISGIVSFGTDEAKIETSSGSTNNADTAPSPQYNTCVSNNSQHTLITKCR